MGVKTCYRCPNIMCNRLLFGNYLCDECWTELLRAKATWPEKITTGEVERRIRAFRETEKGTYEPELTVDEAFKRVLASHEDD
jgi:hypothetical protein